MKQWLSPRSRSPGTVGLNRGRRNYQDSKTLLRSISHAYDHGRLSLILTSDSAHSKSFLLFSCYYLLTSISWVPCVRSLRHIREDTPYLTRAHPHLTAIHRLPNLWLLLLQIIDEDRGRARHWTHLGLFQQRILELLLQKQQSRDSKP